MSVHRTIYNDDQAIFRDAVRKFVAAEIAPHFSRWEEQGIVDRGNHARVDFSLSMIAVERQECKHATLLAPELTVSAPISRPHY
jgi:hypothetical protein